MIANTIGDIHMISSIIQDSITHDNLISFNDNIFKIFLSRYCKEINNKRCYSELIIKNISSLRFGRLSKKPQPFKYILSLLFVDTYKLILFLSNREFYEIIGEDITVELYDKKFYSTDITPLHMYNEFYLNKYI